MRQHRSSFGHPVPNDGRLDVTGKPVEPHNEILPAEQVVSREVVAAAYRDMAADEERELEGLEWSEATLLIPNLLLQPSNTQLF